MGKIVKHSAKLRRKSSGTIFKKRDFRGDQNTSVPKAWDTLPQLSTSTNGQESQDALSTSARKLQVSKNIQLKTATTRTTNNEGTSDDSSILPSHFLLKDNDILKSIMWIIETCSECKNQSVETKTDMFQKRGLFLYLEFEYTKCEWRKC